MYLCGDAHEIWGRKINKWLEITTGCLVQANGTETVFCAGNIAEEKILTYHWNEKFSKWSVYDEFNDYINSLTESSKKGLPTLDLFEPGTYNLPKLSRNYRVGSQIKIDALNILKKNRLLYITGMSGIGKTSLSISLSEALKNETELNGIYFIDASTHLK